MRATVAVCGVLLVSRGVEWRNAHRSILARGGRTSRRLLDGLQSSTASDTARFLSLSLVLHIHLLPAICRHLHPVAQLSNRRAPFGPAMMMRVGFASPIKVAPPTCERARSSWTRAVQALEARLRRRLRRFSIRSCQRVTGSSSA